MCIYFLFSQVASLKIIANLGQCNSEIATYYTIFIHNRKSLRLNCIWRTRAHTSGERKSERSRNLLHKEKNCCFKLKPSSIIFVLKLSQRHSISHSFALLLSSSRLNFHTIELNSGFLNYVKVCTKKNFFYNKFQMRVREKL